MINGVKIRMKKWLRWRLSKRCEEEVLLKYFSTECRICSSVVGGVAESCRRVGEVLSKCSGDGVS